MAKNIIMQVLTSAGYEPMYPFNPAQILNATVASSSTATQYNLTITGIPTPITNAIGNKIGLICFIPKVSNAANAKISINGDTAKPILFASGVNIQNNILMANRPVYVKFYNGNFYLTMDKAQVGLPNVDNTSDLDKPISRATQTALGNKLNIPQKIPRNANLNSYNTLEKCGLYYNDTNDDVETIANVPEQRAFSLFVEKHAGVKQTFTVFDVGRGIRTYVRNYYEYTGEWGSWVQQAFVFFGTSNPDQNTGFDGNIYIKYE